MIPSTPERRGGGILELQLFEDCKRSQSIAAWKPQAGTNTTGKSHKGLERKAHEMIDSRL
eukprot:1160019-Pelagomonas_calceolata.AAC.4